jgi:hypothetical protein
MRLILQPHPASPPSPVEQIVVYFERVNRFRFWAQFELRGALSQVVWPASVLGGRADDLWRTTCFEAFLKGDGPYWEFNFSPSQQWASYSFDAYRSGQRPAAEVAAPAQLELEESYAELEVTFEQPPGVTHLGLSAVIQSIDGAISYWALAHPSAKPDFHHPDSFVLDLP